MSTIEEIVFVGASVLSAHFRGKSFPASELPGVLARGIGQSPSNLYLGAFGPMQTTTFGTRGEVFLVPDPSSRVCLASEGEAPEHFYIGDFRDAGGAPWAYCPRDALRRALADLEHAVGWRLLCTFEQEFLYDGVPSHPWRPYQLDALRPVRGFAAEVLARLRDAGVRPDGFLAEYGPQQFEITTAPAVGVRAADEAVIVREVLRAVAHRHGHSVSLTPIPTPDGIGNGTHIHFSFLDVDGRPAMHDPDGTFGLCGAAESFAAGVLEHLPALCALTTPSVVSYYRLRPNRWAPVYADIGEQDRGSALRVAPTAGPRPEDRARQYNLEFRVADATANPYLALTGMVRAGLDGIARGLRLAGGPPRLLPRSLPEALDVLERIPDPWLGAPLRGGYVQFKRAEIAGLEGLDEIDICRRYAEVY